MNKRIHFFIFFLLITTLTIPITAQNTPEPSYVKSIILDYHIKDGKITYLGSRMFYGYPPTLSQIPSTFEGKLLGTNDGVITPFRIPDPRIQFTEDGAVFIDNRNFSVIIPYSKDLSALGILERENKTLLIRTDVRQVVEDFCKSHPNDPDCGSEKPSTGLSGAVALVAVCIVGGGWYLLKQRRTGQK